MFLKIKRFLLPLMVLGLTGCSSSLVLETRVDVPEPLVQPLPLNVAVYYPEGTRNHVYSENTRDRRNWSITTGPSQLALFSQILESMFSSTHSVEKLEDVTSEHDLVIVPMIRDMQFALPRETRMDVYEVWIAYELSVQQPLGQAITTLSFNGYGKSPSAFFNNDQEGLSLAANEAFRDLGAKLLVNFKQHPDIQKWLSSKASQHQSE